ncbi:phosphonate ABC transporter, permease protein PhnE [Pseudarthrobacter sp. SSS035]|uniref:phosphonate ABC transporter, permease protein PhnE n=1 Tax=Pseudarthrobacter sp. SSS035 TaxID=2931399 RepID=UPI00200D32D4|nr:phosphonate ABC transporter, permease protein PhnE [Pseudarthrobacter sp. SSS035]
MNKTATRARLEPYPPAVSPSPSLCPPFSREKLTLWILFATIIPLTAISANHIEFDLRALGGGFEDVANLIARMLPPEVSDPPRIGELLLETLMMALLGTVLATVLSIPLAFLAAANTSPHPLVQRAARMIITMCRAVPDLVFAVLFVRALGIGVLPGVLALALHSVGMMAKLFADAIEQIDEGPREAVRATGAARLSELVTGVLPQVIPAWIGTFIYRVDINLRTSVVLGFVGAGGIGFALQDALRGLMYESAMGIVLIILVIIAAMEVVAIGLRRTLLDPASGSGPAPRAIPASSSVRPPWTRDRIIRTATGAATVGAIVWSFVHLRINPLAPIASGGELIAVFGRLLPPSIDGVEAVLFTAVVETLAIGLVATVLGAILAVPVGILAAGNISPSRPVYWAARAVVLVVRAIPELILAVIFVAAIGLGPMAGALALAVGTIGFLGKLVADSIEEIPSGPIEAVRSVGGGWWDQLFSAVIPQSLPQLVGHWMYMLDVNIRTSTVLGIVGAGGIGFLLMESIRA